MLFLGIAPGDPLSVYEAAIRAVQSIHDLAFGVGVDAFIEPCFFELVCGHHGVPVLVSELVHHYYFRYQKAFGNKPLGVCRDECRIFHATGAEGRWINDRELLVWIWAIPSVE